MLARTGSFAAIMALALSSLAVASQITVTTVGGSAPRQGASVACNACAGAPGTTELIIKGSSGSTCMLEYYSDGACSNSISAVPGPNTIHASIGSYKAVSTDPHQSCNCS